MNKHTNAKQSAGLKALAGNRHLGAAKRYIPRDTDGAYRVEGRRDGVSPRDILGIVRKRQDEEG